MPAGVSNYGSEAWLGMLFGITDLPTEYYVALCNDEPGADMDGDVISDLEPDSGMGYARVLYGIGNSYWYADSGFVTNVSTINFPMATDEWGFFNHFALMSDPDEGEIYAWGEFLNPQYIVAGTTMAIPQGGLVVTLSSLDNSIVP